MSIDIRRAHDDAQPLAGNHDVTRRITERACEVSLEECSRMFHPINVRKDE